MDLLAFKRENSIIRNIDSLHKILIEKTTNTLFWLSYSRNAVMKQKTQYLINIHDGGEYIEWFYGSLATPDDPYFESLTVDTLPTGSKLEIKWCNNSDLYLYFIDDELVEFTFLGASNNWKHWAADITPKYCITQKQKRNP